MDSTNKNVEYSTPEELCEAIRADIDTYDGILIGFGTELFRQKNTDIDEVLNNLAGYLEHKNYFIISSVKDDVLRRSEINQKRIGVAVRPEGKAQVRVKADDAAGLPCGGNGRKVGVAHGAVHQ